MADEIARPTEPVRRGRALHVSLGILMVLSVVAGIAMLGVLFLVTMDPFAGETMGRQDYRRMSLIAVAPWLLAGTMAIVRVRLGRR